MNMNNNSINSLVDTVTKMEADVRETFDKDPHGEAAEKLNEELELLNRNYSLAERKAILAGVEKNDTVNGVLPDIGMCDGVKGPELGVTYQAMWAPPDFYMKTMDKMVGPPHKGEAISRPFDKADWNITKHWMRQYIQDQVKAR